MKLSVVLAALAISCVSVADETWEVDEIISKRADVTGDGIRDLFTLKLKAKSWSEPISWKLVVTDDHDRIIYSHEQNDLAFNDYFNEASLFNEPCDSYLSCKKQYYLKGMLSHNVSHSNSSFGERFYDRQFAGSIYQVGFRELTEKYHLPQSSAIALIEDLAARLKSESVPVLDVSISPTISCGPLVFVKEVQGFIKVYEC